MADNKPAWGTATNKQVREHIETVQPKCAHCGKMGFQIESVGLNDSDEYQPYNVVTELNLINPLYYMFGMVPLTCLSCGHVAFLSFPHIARKINERPTT